MNSPEVISVDPGRKTLGALHNVSSHKIIRQAGATLASVSAVAVPKKKGVLDFVLATSCPRPSKYSSYILLLRVLWGALLIVTGSFIISGEITSPGFLLSPFATGLSLILVGAFSVLGMAERPVSLAAMAFFGIVSVESTFEGVFNLVAMALTLPAFGFVIFGAGRYSVDFLLRKFIFLEARRRRDSHRNNALTYRAFRNS